MEAEVTAQSPDNVSDYFNDVVAPAGDFGSEVEFREFISSPENAKSYFDDVVRERGDFGSDQEFVSFLGISGSTPTPTPTPQKQPQQPTKYVPDATRKLEKDEISTLIKTFLPGGELTNSADIVAQRLAGKTEAEIVKMYPALGKQLATRKQNVQSGPKASGSQSESSASVLPSLIDQAKTEQAFSDYEVFQKQFAAADYDRENAKQSSKDQQKNPFGGGGVGESLYLDATKGMYTSAKVNADQARQKVDDIIKPRILTDVNDTFLKTNETGFSVPNFDKISDYTNQIVDAYGMPNDGYLRQYIYNQVVAEATYKAIKPKIDKYFEPERKKIDAEIFEGFKADDEEKFRLNAQAESVKAQIQLELTNELSSIDNALQQGVVNETMNYESLTKTLMDQAQLFKSEYEQGRIPREVYESNVAGINEKLKEAYTAYNETQGGLFEGYLTTANQIQSKYNTRLQRQLYELETSAQTRVDALAKEYEGKVAPERLKRLNEAYARAVKIAQSEYEGEVKAAFAEQPSSPLSNPVANWINDKLKINYQAATVGLGGVVKAYGIAFNVPSMQLVGDKLSVKYTLPQAQADDFGDLFDPRNFSLLSGQLIGVAAPTALATMGTAAVTKNAGATARVAAAGLTQFYSNAAMMSAMMWDDTFKATGSVAEANKKSSKMFDAQVKMIPIYFAGSIPYVGNLVSKTINKLPLAARVTMGAAVGIAQETLEELGENIATTNIKADKEAFDNFFENVGDQWKETMITVAPVAFMEGGGQVNRELSPEEKMIEAARSFGAKAKYNEIKGFGKREWVANVILQRSEGFATTAINTMFSSGIIDQATRDEMIQLTDEAAQNISDARSLNLNDGEALVYNALAQNRNALNRQMLQAKEAGNQSLEIALKEKLSLADKTVREFSATRQGDYGVLTFSDGSSVVLNDIRSEGSLARIADLVKNDGVAGVKFYSKDSDALMQQIQQINTQPIVETQEQAAEAPTPDTVSSETLEVPIAETQTQTPIQDATQTGEIQQSSEGEYSGTTQQQQGQQADRNNQEENVTPSQAEAGGGDQLGESGAQQEVTQTFEERKAAAREAIKQAKEKRRQALNNMGIMAPDPKQRAYMDIEVVRAYVDLAKVMIEEGIKNFKDFVAELGEEPTAEIRYAWDVANGDATLEQGLTTTGGDGGGGTTGTDEATTDEGGNKIGKVRAMIQKVANRMRQKDIPEDQIQKVLEAGTYQPMSMAQMDKAAEALIEEYGVDAAIDILRSDESFNYEIIKALYNRKLGQLKEAAAASDGASIEQAVEIANTIKSMAEASTSEARSLGFNRYIYLTNPDLFYKEKIKDTVEAANVASTVKGKGREGKIKTFAFQARKIRTDAISLLSEVMGGRITPEQLFDPNSKFYLSDAKMRESLKVLLTFGESLNPETRGILQQMFRDIKGMDRWAREANMEKAKELIKANLNDINGRLPVPLDEASLDELAKNFTAMWKALVDSYLIANSKGEKAFVSQRDILNQLANVVAGKVDAVILFAVNKKMADILSDPSKAKVNLSKIGKESFASIVGAIKGIVRWDDLSNPDSKNFISDPRLLDAVRDEIFKGNRKQLLDAINAIFEGKNFETDLSAVEQLINTEINKYNNSIPKPLSQDELSKLKDSLFFVFKEKAYAALDVSGANRLTRRMEFLMKKLINQNASEDGGASWQQLVKNLNLGGVFNSIENQKEATVAIAKSLARLNPTLQTPLDTAEIQELAESIVDIYSEVAEKKIKDMLERQMPKPRTFAGRERISRAAKAVIYGSLDFGNKAEENQTLSKFSVIFGGIDPNQFTDAQKTKLNQLAGEYVQAKPGFQKQIAMARFNNALDAAIAYQTKWTKATYLFGRGGFWLENYIYNNLLFAYGTMVKALRGNVERLIEKSITLALLGESDTIRFNNRRNLPNVKIDIDGREVEVAVNINEVFDSMYSAIRGLPKLAEAKSTGLSNAELILRDTRSLAGRRLQRMFTIPAGRLLMTIDAMTTTSSVLTTKRQVLMQAIIDTYKTYGVTKPRAEIQAIVDDILVPNDTAYENALAQAAQDIMNSKIYKDYGMTPADFPVADPRKSAPLSREAKVYNEWLMRTREILDEQETLRASTSAVNYGWMPMSGTIEAMMSQIDTYAARITNEMTYLGTPRGSLGQVATWISKVSNTLPALKYVGIAPLFVNATFNALNNMIRITPGLNVIQFAKYNSTGARGAYSSTGKREYEFESIVDVDKRNMIPTLVLTNLGLMGALAVLSTLRGDDEYEREKIVKGKGTFLTPMKLPPWLAEIRNEKGEQVYRPGKIYLDGKEVSDYRDGAFSFFWGAVATIDNERLGFANNPYSDAPFKDEASGVSDVMYAYVAGVIATAGEQSMIREQAKMVTDILDLAYETPDREYTTGDKFQKLIARKGGSLVKMLVPYGRSMGDVAQLVRNGDEEAMAKQARGFFEYAAQGTAYEDWVLKSNKVDWFGNPVKAEFFRASATPIPSFKDGAGEANKMVQLHLTHNYIPVLPPSERIMVTIDKDDVGGEEYLEGYINSLKAMVEDGQEDRVTVKPVFGRYDGEKKVYERVTSTIELTAGEQSLYNEQRAKFVGSIVKYGSNMSAFDKMDNEGYRAAMDRLYSMGRNYAQLKSLGELIEKDREDIIKAFASQVSRFQEDFGGMGIEMPGIGVEINEDFLKQFEN